MEILGILCSAFKSLTIVRYSKDSVVTYWVTWGRCLVNTMTMPNVTHDPLFHCHSFKSFFLSLFLYYSLLFYSGNGSIHEANKSIFTVRGECFSAKRRHGVLHSSGAWKSASSISLPDMSRRTSSGALSTIEPIMMESVLCWMVS